MNNLISKNKCTGCTACANICPKGAIIMKEDENGFKYPYIDKDKCINCGLCKKICPVINTNRNDSINKCYVAYNKDDLEKEKASSGAVFSLIAEYVLNHNGIVIGAAFDKNNKLKHVAVTSSDELDKLKGSKYLQSDLDNIFNYIKMNVKDKKILFVGTPCQVGGLRAFIKKDYNNLICVDVVCHGVPSPKLFDKYVSELEKKHNDKLLNYNFRDKCSGWDTYSNTAIFKKNKVTELSKNNKYMRLFLSDVALRESCYQCNFKIGNKYSDITLGDFWGVKKKYSDMYNKKGVSAVIINNEIGLKIFECIKDKLIYKECNLNDIIVGNSSLRKSAEKNKSRDSFFLEMNKLTIDELVNKYTKKSSLLKKIYGKLRNMIFR